MAGIPHRQEKRAPVPEEEPAAVSHARAPSAPSLTDLGPQAVQALSRSAGNHAVARMLARRALDRQPDGGTVAPPAPAADAGAPAGPSREQKLATFHEHVKAARWAEAALEANSWSIGDIEREVARPTVDHHARVAIYMQSLIVMWGWPPHVPDAIRNFDRPAAVEGRKQFLHHARTKAQWDRWAVALDGFDKDSDIVEMVGWLLGQELSALKDAALAAGSPARVVDPVSDRLRLIVAEQMKGMVGEKATWLPSGGAATRSAPTTTPGGVPPAYGTTALASPTTFADWALAPNEAPFPALAHGVTINCWEMILLAAYRAGAVSWKWINALYSAPTSSKGWYRLLEQTLMPKGPKTYDRKAPPRTRPRAGDIVMFNGSDHVTLATGSLKPGGDPELYTFWPPPNNFSGDPTGRTDDTVKTSSIEELAGYMERHRMGPVRVQFGAPPW